MSGCSEATAALNKLSADIPKLIPDMEAKMIEIEQRFQGLKTSFPVTPNLLKDTYHFSKLCKGQVNTPMSMADAHGGIWSAYLTHGGSVANGTITVLTLDKLKDYGLQPVVGDDFHLASPYATDTTRPFYGSGFRVVLLDFSITTAGQGVGYLHQAGNPAGHMTTGWYAGKFKTQSSILVNVLEQSGNTYFNVQANMPAALRADKTLVGKGWKKLRGVRDGFGGGHQPWAYGVGSMKIALCLPYVGFGDHGDIFLWADALTKASSTEPYRYSHWMGD